MDELLKIQHFPPGTRVRLRRNLDTRHPEGLEGIIEGNEYDSDRNSNLVWVKWDNLDQADPFYEPEDQDSDQGLNLLQKI